MIHVVKYEFQTKLYLMIWIIDSQTQIIYIYEGDRTHNNITVMLLKKKVESISNSL